MSSTKEIFKHTKDSVDLKINNFFSSNKYIIKDEFLSKTKRTSLSIPSLFNFNIHQNINNDSLEIVDKGLMIIRGFGNLTFENLLVDSLYTKNVQSHSYGIRAFKNGINKEDFFYYWGGDEKNGVFKNFFYKTIIGTFFKNAKRRTEKDDKFRKHALNALEETILKENNFYYFHLYFPHDPYSYYDEYPARNLNYYAINETEYLNEHIKYKRWFTEKLINIMSQEKFKNARIIITGDHGFRFNKSFNPFHTSGFFKGYSNKSLDQIESVQDIGHLILNSF